ncbi:GNAT family N-acetyltransferase [Microbacterium sp.]|uniref:GNAT family N-acetyltransferase n=1 Tax=Microbacterium sp. TaxID=51671 RepID=UPI00391BCABE
MISVRAAVFPRDAGAVSALVADYLRQTEAEKGDHGLVAPHAPLPDRYAREIDDPASVFAARRVLLGSVDGVDCGVVVVDDTAGVTEISRFWTTPPARGRGVGSALLSAALEGATGAARLSVWEWRAPALSLYRRWGFAEVASWDDRPQLVCLERAAPVSATT